MLPTVNGIVMMCCSTIPASGLRALEVMRGIIADTWWTGMLEARSA